ncbi:MAG: hypothetical protein Q8K99_14520 [Actinomycetota bacterium]|nr:hypothetical protein [Actinomycetota bacterium]
MNRAYDYGTWQRTRRAAVGALASRAESPRARRGRMRTSEEREMIARIVAAEVRRREGEGRIVRLGPRRYELRP